MATLTFKSYIPKDKSFQIDSSNVPVEVPPALGRAASNNNWCQMSVGDSKTIVQDAQALRDDLTRTQGIYLERPHRGHYLYLILYSSLNSRE
jgi:hypothetical protein